MSGKGDSDLAETFPPCSQLLFLAPKPDPDPGPALDRGGLHGAKFAGLSSSRHPRAGVVSGLSSTLIVLTVNWLLSEMDRPDRLAMDLRIMASRCDSASRSMMSVAIRLFLLNPLLPRHGSRCRASSRDAFLERCLERDMTTSAMHEPSATTPATDAMMIHTLSELVLSEAPRGVIRPWELVSPSTMDQVGMVGMAFGCCGGEGLTFPGCRNQDTERL